MSNKHFSKTEQAIFIAYFKFKDYPSAKRIAKCAGVSRSTVYRHHQSIYRLPRDYEDFLLLSYHRAMRTLLRKPNSSLEVIYLRTLVFISSYGKTIRILFTDGHKNIIKRMLRHLKPKVISSWPAASNPDQIYDIYANEVLGLIELWAKQGFPTSQLDNTLGKILYLTKTAPTHLAPVVDPLPPAE